MQTLKEGIKKGILDAARQEFLFKNYNQASMREIAKEAGVSVSNVYNYFKSKKLLFVKIVSPAYNALEMYKEHFKNVEKCHKKKICDADQKIVEITDNINYIVQKFHVELVLLFNKSKGTKYENTREDLFDSMTAHFIDHVCPVHDLEILKNDNAYFVIHIIVNNLLEAISEICQHYKNPEWAKKNIEMYVNYHFAGMRNFACVARKK